MQRYLNRNYEDYIGLCPCDGIYARRTSKALIYAVQAEEKMPTAVANGNCGPATKNALPNIMSNGQYSGSSYLGDHIVLLILINLKHWLILHYILMDLVMVVFLLV